MEELRFLVQGSAPEPYEVVFQYHETQLNALCTCPAGENQMACKHRLAILGGSAVGIVSSNSGSVQQVQAWLPGTTLAAALSDLATLANQAEALKKLISSQKKKLSRIMGADLMLTSSAA